MSKRRRKEEANDDELIPANRDFVEFIGGVIDGQRELAGKKPCDLVEGMKKAIEKFISNYGDRFLSDEELVFQVLRPRSARRMFLFISKEIERHPLPLRVNGALRGRPARQIEDRDFMWTGIKKLSPEHQNIVLCEMVGRHRFQRSSRRTDTSSQQTPSKASESSDEDGNNELAKCYVPAAAAILGLERRTYERHRKDAFQRLKDILENLEDGC